jgi:hypothetical protein
MDILVEPVKFIKEHRPIAQDIFLNEDFKKKIGIVNKCLAWIR